MGHLEDVKSDFSALHGIHDIEEVTADYFFPRARRLVSYKGAVRFAAEEAAEKSKKSPTGRERSGEVQHYKDVHTNPEITNLGLFEAGSG